MVIYYISLSFSQHPYLVYLVVYSISLSFCQHHYLVCMLFSPVLYHFICYLWLFIGNPFVFVIFCIILYYFILITAYKLTSPQSFKKILGAVFYLNNDSCAICNKDLLQTNLF